MSNPYELSDDMPVYVISVARPVVRHAPADPPRLRQARPGDHRAEPGPGRRYSTRDILALREIQRLSQEEGVNLSGIKLLLDQHRELEQARRLVAELHAEVAQLRVELESTRAVAARLAELRRSGSDTRSGREGREGLVPVRSARVAVWEPIAGPCRRIRAAQRR